MKRPRARRSRSRIAGRRAVWRRAAIRRSRCLRIVQGALFPELRRESAACLSEMPFDGFAIGGLAVGESKSEREDVCEFTAQLLPADKPRYLMGVGTPLDILEAVHRGVDMFDCIMPTQLAQRGAVFTSRGFLQMRRGVYKFSEEKLDPDLRLPDLRALLARLSASPHEDERDARLAAPRQAQHPFLPPAHARHPRRAFWPTASSISIGKSAPFCTNPTWTIRSRAQKPKRKKLAHVGQLRGAHRAGRIRQHPADFVRRDHAFAHAADGGGAAGFTSSNRISPSASGFLRRKRGSAPLVIWDVGLGAAANAMAAIHCYEEQAAAGPVRPLRIISFENDLDSLRLAFRHDRDFPYLRHGGPAGILKSGAVAIAAACRLELVAPAGRFSRNDVHGARLRRT